MKPLADLGGRIECGSCLSPEETALTFNFGDRDKRNAAVQGAFPDMYSVLYAAALTIGVDLAINCNGRVQLLHCHQDPIQPRRRSKAHAADGASRR